MMTRQGEKMGEEVKSEKLQEDSSR
jgi:hypothetical protein